MRKRMLALLLAFVMAVGPLPAAALAENAAVSPIRIGDYVQMGQYNGSSMLWRCVAFEKVTGNDANGNPITDSTDTKTAYEDGYLPLMLADIAICLKGFDHPGSVTTGSHGRHTDRTYSGSNYWGDSNIRDWLNSSADSVTWSCGNSPSYSGSSDYTNEKGFLTNFNNTEKAAIKTVTQKALLAELDKDISGAMGSAAHTYAYEITDFVKNYADAYSEQITDGMFLLDVQQLENVYLNLNDYYKLSSDYWLRSPEGDGHSYVRDVTAGGIVGRDTAYNPEAVRPAFFLDPAAALDGAGTKAAPYTLAAPAQSEHTHCVCGATDCSGDGHQQITWTAWNETDTLPAEEGNYYLTGDVTLSQTWSLGTKNVKLDLNGHSVTSGAFSDDDSLYLIKVDANGSLTVTDCQAGAGISASSSSLYNSVFGIYSSGDITLTGGAKLHVESSSRSATAVRMNGSGNLTVSGNAEISATTTARTAYSVENAGTGTATMTGNAKINAVSAQHNAYGIYNYGTSVVNGNAEITATSSASSATFYACGIEHRSNSSGTVTVSGSAKVTAIGDNGATSYGIYNDDNRLGAFVAVTENAAVTGARSGVYLNRGVLNLSGAPTITGGAEYGDVTLVYESNGKIAITGVLTYTKPISVYNYQQTPFTSGWSTHMAQATPADYFVPTASGYDVVVDESTGELKFAQPQPQAHTHAVSVGCETDSGEPVEFTAWNTDNCLPTVSGSYYLTTDVDLRKGNYGDDRIWAVPAEVDIDLCLNGHTIRGAETDQDGYYVIKVSGGTLDLCDCATGEGGKITNGKCGVNLLNGGVFHMYGGSITENRNGGMNGGGGVCVESNCAFHMHGGSITGNTAYRGGGVAVYSGGKFLVDGNVKITGNQDYDSSADNVSLYADSSDANTAVTVAGALGADARIGVNKRITGNVAAEPGAGYTITESDAAKFSSDKSEYKTSLSEGKVVLEEDEAPDHTHAWAAAWSKDATHHWHVCTADGCGITDYSNCGESGAAYAAHVWNDGEVTKEPTATAEGVKTYTCTVCQATKTETIPVLTFSISGTVTDSGDATVNGATVRLMRGSTQIGQSVTTDQQGNYSFVGVAPGLYNVVATKDNITKTILVEITSQNVTNQNIKMPDGNKNSVVEITSGTPDVVVGGVDKIAEAETVSSGETVTIKLTVEKKETPADKAEIDKAAQGKTVGLYLDLSLLKTSEIGGNTTENSITNTQSKVLSVVVPYDFTGKTGVTVYRKHGTENAAALTALTSIPVTPADGTFYADSANGRITIYADKFSTYAIGYTAASQTAYTLTVNGGTGSGSYAEGTTVSISATVPSGKQFTGWTGAAVANPDSTNTTLVMPARDTTVTANSQNVSNGGGGGGWSGPTTYPVETPSADGGKVTVSPKSAASGTTVTLTLTPDQGYTISGVTVTDRNGKQIAVTGKGDGKYTFIMPSGKVTVTGAFTKIMGGYKDCPRDSTCPIWPYTDTDLAAWYHDGIHYCVENGLMNGYGNGKLGPNDNLTRVQFAQTLFNKEGRPVVNYQLQYDDIAAGAWYTEAVRWAASQGIVSGYGNGHFGPNDPITREQLAVILWRYVGSPAATEKELHFTDADKASGYALEALCWAVENGIINGYGNGQLDPQGPATRAQMAQMLKGFFA